MGGEQDDLATLCAIGVLAAMTAALAHEAVGHGGACLVNGGEVTLLSVIWFRCSPGGVLIDLAGPLGGLVAGLGGLALATWGPCYGVRTRLFGLTLGSFAVFWFAAQMISQTVSGLDDWRVAANWSAGWRIAVVTVGVIIYGTMVHLAWLLAGRIGRGPFFGRRFLVPYAAGALGLVACAALRKADGSALETARAVGLAPLGYVWAVTRRSVAGGGGARIARSRIWIVAGVVGLILYGAAFGPGIGRMA